MSVTLINSDASLLLRSFLAEVVGGSVVVREAV